MQQDGVDCSLVRFIHTRTSVPNDWFCRQLHCGHPGNISKYVKAVSVAKNKQIVTLKKRMLKSGDPLVLGSGSFCPWGVKGTHIALCEEARPPQ